MSKVRYPKTKMESIEVAMKTFNITEDEAISLLEEVQSFIDELRFQRKFNTVTGYLTGRSDLTPKIILGGGSYTNDKEVVVGVSEAYWQLSKEELVMIVWALKIHELFHTLSSNFNRLSEYMESQTKKMKEEGFPESIASYIVHSIANILEDGRIERIATRYLPGTVKHLQFLNVFHWETGGVTGEEDQISLLLNTMLTHSKLGIYPKDYAKYALNTEADKAFNEVKPLIPKAITARSHKDNLDVCIEVIDALLPFFKSQYEAMKNEIEAMQQLQEMLEEMANSSDYENSKETHHNIADGAPSPTHLIPQPKPEEVEETVYGEGEGEKFKEVQSNEESEEGSKEGKGAKTNGNSRDLSSGRKESLIEGAPNTLSDLLESIKEELSKDVTRELDEFARSRKKEIKSSHQKEGPFNFPNALKELGNNFIENPLKQEPLYELPKELKVRANQFKKEIQKIMQSKSKQNLNGQKKGTLNEEDLFRVGLQEYNVFTVEGSKSRADHAIYILQDGSGSMHGEKEKSSAFALSIIEEGLKGVVPFKVTTFKAAHGGVIHNVVKPWNGVSKKNYAFTYHTLIPSGGGNEDDISIRIATEELKQRPEKDKVLIVLSDGLPYSEERTKMAIKAARAANIHVVGIMFGDEQFRSSSYENYRNMYEKNIIATTPAGIPKKLIETLKSILSR